jgi:hypothetical protein
VFLSRYMATSGAPTAAARGRVGPRCAVSGRTIDRVSALTVQEAQVFKHLELSRRKPRLPIKC